MTFWIERLDDDGGGIHVREPGGDIAGLVPRDHLDDEIGKRSASEARRARVEANAAGIPLALGAQKANGEQSLAPSDRLVLRNAG